MAVTANVYNHTAALIAGQSIDKANIKAMLLTSSASFVATDTTVNAVAGSLTGSPAARAKEVYGNGWTQGGPVVSGVAASTITTNDAKLSASQISVTASGGDIGPCRFVLLYDATSGKPLILYDLGQDEHAGDTTPFKFTFDLTGGTDAIFTLTV
jgi:hypothetical protein